jgi:hypothetical protein
MKEIDIFMHLDVKVGLTFSGAVEVNDLINRGGKVISIKPGIGMDQRDGDTEYLYVTGWVLKVTVDDSNV